MIVERVEPAMNRRVDAATAMKCVKMTCLPVVSWPLPLNSSPFVIFQRSVARWCILVNLTITEAGLFYAMIQRKNDINTMILLVTEICACLMIHGKIIVCYVKSNNLQVLFHRIEEFVKNANVEETEVVQRIVDECARPFGIPLLFSLVGCVAYVIAPVFSSQSTPISTEYPFSTTSIWIRTTIYVMQSLIVAQVAADAMLSTMCAIMLWYTVARFRILSEKIRKSRKAEDIRDHIAAHAELFEYMDLLRPIAQGLTVWTVYTTMICLICVGYMLMRRPPLYEIVKFVCFELVALTEFFIFCWPAHNLIEASEDIGEAAATCEWIGKSSEMRKNIVLMIRRSQLPVVINVAGILPPLSLQLYASTISSNFGYMTALRSLMDDAE